MSELVYKKIRFVSSLLKNNEIYICLVLTATLILPVLGLITSFKGLVSLFIIADLLLAFRIKNIFISTFLVSIFTLPIFSPNKYSTIEVIKGGIEYEGLREGYYLGYGVNISNVFICLSSLCFIREWVMQRKSGLKHGQILSRTLMPLLLFFGIGLGVSYRYSPFVEASSVWLFQYIQILPVTLFIYYIYTFHKNMNYLFYATVFSSALVQVGVSFWQFFTQSGGNFVIESDTTKNFFATGLDENNAFYRVNGTFLYHNQLALILALFVCLLLPYALKKHKPFYLLLSIFILLTIVLTQSRSIWVAVFLVLLFIYNLFRKQIGQVVKLISLPKIIVYAILFLLVTSFIILPRVILSFNSGYEGAGIPVRKNMIYEALQAITFSPWIGFGIGTNEYTLHSIFPDGVMSVFPSAVHMGYLQLLLETGLLGLGFFLWPFIYILRSYLINPHPSLAAVHFLTGLMVFSLYYLVQPHVGIVEFSYLGIILSFGVLSIVNYN